MSIRKLRSQDSLSGNGDDRGTVDALEAARLAQLQGQVADTQRRLDQFYSVSGMVINPSHPYLSHWDVALGVCLLWVVHVTPFSVAFLATNVSSGFRVSDFVVRGSRFGVRGSGSGAVRAQGVEGSRSGGKVYPRDRGAEENRPSRRRAARHGGGGRPPAARGRKERFGSQRQK